MVLAGHLAQAGGGIGADSEDLIAEREELELEFAERGELAVAERAPIAAVEDEDSGFFREGGAEREVGLVDGLEGDDGRPGTGGERPGLRGGGGNGGGGGAHGRDQVESEHGGENGGDAFRGQEVGGGSGEVIPTGAARRTDEAPGRNGESPVRP